MSNGYGYLGYEVGSSNNSVLVSGTGSVWTNHGELTVGRSSTSNRLTISNSGRVISVNGYVGGVPGGGNGASNSVLVTDSGSVWKNSGSLSIGWSGAGNGLVVNNGGQVNSAVGGRVGNLSSSSWNSVLVTGTGSSWSNGGTLFVGRFGSSNTFVISGGGVVSCGTGEGASGYLGYDIGSSSNSVLVTGNGSVWTNGDLLYVGYSGAGNALTVSNGGQVIDSASYVGYNSSSSNNSVSVTGTGSIWSNDFSVIGYSGPSNSLVIKDGGQVFSGGSVVGLNSSSSNNNVSVTGLGSLWRNDSSLSFSASSSSSSLVISNGGKVLVDYKSPALGSGIGANNGTNNSTLVVDGGVLQCGDRWLVGGLFANTGLSNVLLVAGGTVVVASKLFVACGNSIKLDGGSILVTNASATAVLDVRGKFVLSDGTLRVDTLVMTNSCAQFIRTGGTLIYGVAVLDPNRDDDGDGISNAWEQSNGLDPLNAADANADNDGDGFTNLQEFQAGTDPTNSASAFRIIGLTPEAADMRVTWTTAGGRTNIVQTATDLSGAYTNVSPNMVIAGSVETSTNYVDTGGATNAAPQFYRVRLVP